MVWGKESLVPLGSNEGLHHHKHHLRHHDAMMSMESTVTTQNLRAKEMQNTQKILEKKKVKTTGVHIAKQEKHRLNILEANLSQIHSLWGKRNREKVQLAVMCPPCKSKQAWAQQCQSSA